MQYVYEFNPRRFERLLTILAMNNNLNPNSAEELEFLYQFLHDYDHSRILKSFPSNVKNRILMRAFENIYGIQKESDELVQILSKSIKNRPFEKMCQMDRNLLMLGAFELRHNDTEPNIIIKEILIISDLLGNQKAGSYLSGILKTLAFGERISVSFKVSMKPRPKIKLKKSTPPLL